MIRRALTALDSTVYTRAWLSPCRALGTFAHLAVAMPGRATNDIPSMTARDGTAARKKRRQRAWPQMCTLAGYPVTWSARILYGVDGHGPALCSSEVSDFVHSDVQPLGVLAHSLGDLLGDEESRNDRGVIF